MLVYVSEPSSDLYEMCVCNKSPYFRIQDFVVSPVSRHFPYSRDFVVSNVSGHFPYSRDFVVSPVFRHFWKRLEVKKVVRLQGWKVRRLEGWKVGRSEG